MYRTLTILFIVIISVTYIGCVDVNQASVVDKTPPTINIISPQSNDTLEVGYNSFRIGAYDDNSLNKIELYIDSVLYKTFYFGSDGSYPVIQWEATISLLGKRISYFYKLYDVNGNVSVSTVMHNILVVNVKTPPYPPYSISLLKISANTINISWKDTSKVVSGYEVWRKESSGGSFTKIKEITAGSFNTNDVVINPDLSYTYKMCSFNDAGKSSFSNEVSISGTSTSTDLPAPSNLSAQALSSKRVMLTWKDNSTNENYFKVERKTSSTAYQSIAVLQANSTAYLDSIGLLAGLEYFYRIKVFSDKDSSTSPEVSVKMPTYEINTPTELKVVMFNSSTVRLSWKSSDSKATKIIIERKTLQSNSFTEIAVLPHTDKAWDDGTIQTGTTYVYRIKATDDVYSSAYSDEVTITAQAITINPPSNLYVIFLTGNIMQLNWVDNSSNEIGFIIERKEETSPVDFQQIAFLGVNSVQYNDLTTDAQKTYIYRVAATDGVTKSLYSNTFTITNPGAK